MNQFSEDQVSRDAGGQFAAQQTAETAGVSLDADGEDQAIRDIDREVEVRWPEATDYELTYDSFEHTTSVSRVLLAGRTLEEDPRLPSDRRLLDVGNDALDRNAEHLDDVEGDWIYRRPVNQAVENDSVSDDSLEDLYGDTPRPWRSSHDDSPF